MKIDTVTVELKALGSLAGDMNIAYQRTDAPLMHIIAKAPPGAAFTVGDHFDTCPVCKHHNVTYEQFHTFMLKDHA